MRKIAVDERFNPLVVKFLTGPCEIGECFWSEAGPAFIQYQLRKGGAVTVAIVTREAVEVLYQTLGSLAGSINAGRMLRPKKRQQCATLRNRKFDLRDVPTLGDLRIQAAFVLVAE